MDEKNILIEPKSVSQLLVTYLKIFFNNYRLTIPVLFLSFILFYFVTENLETKLSSNLIIKNIIIDSFSYALLLLIPVSFISIMYLTILNNFKPQLNRIIDTFLDHYWKILGANLLVCFIAQFIRTSSVYFINELELNNGLQVIFINVIRVMITFIVILLIYAINPYRLNTSRLQFKMVFKYLIAYYFLGLILTLFSDISYYIVFYSIGIFQEIIGDLRLEYIMSYWNVVIFFINLMITFTVPIYIYYNMAAESKNTFQLEEINQINLGQNDEEDDV